MKRTISPLIPVLLCSMTIALVIVSGCTNMNISGLPGFQASQTMSPSGSANGTTGPANTGSPQNTEASPAVNPAPGSQTCDATVNFQTDPNNCGKCGVVCPAHSSCGGGGQCSCDPGYSLQNTQCVPSGSGEPSQNTGGSPTCPAGHESWTVCPDTICYNLTSDPTHCGSCTNAACSSGQLCSNGHCVGGASQVQGDNNACSVSFATYNPEVNAEIYLDNSDTGYTTPYILSVQPGDHTATFKKVGYFDKSTPFTVTAPTAGGICSQVILVPMTSTQLGTTTVTTASNGGICGSRNEGTYCSGVCVNLKVSNNNCGKCSKTCPTGTSCVDGQCTSTSCSNGLTTCSGNCVSLDFSPILPYNCGGCGQKCPSGNNCVYGVCQPIACPQSPKPTHICADYFCCPAGSDNPCDSFGKPGYSFCSNECTIKEVFSNGCKNACKDFKTDVNNCGSCGNKCSGTCTNGKCDSLLAKITIKPSIIPRVTSAPSWTGTWTMTVTNTGPITMTQSGSSVSGTYTNSNGRTGCTISGSVSVNVITGIWHEGTGSGPFEFDRAGTLNNFIGWWGLNSSDLTSRKINNPGGNWNGQKQ